MVIMKFLFNNNNKFFKNFVFQPFSTIEIINNTIMKYNPLVECEYTNKSSNNIPCNTLCVKKNTSKIRIKMKTKDKNLIVPFNNHPQTILISSSKLPVTEFNRSLPKVCRYRFNSSLV
jgi:hypothetical protein